MSTTKTQTQTKDCMFFHTWTQWKIVKDNHYTRKDGYPVVIIEQRRNCTSCEFIEVNIQKKDSAN